jgi:hypothetical protein
MEKSPDHYNTDPSNIVVDMYAPSESKNQNAREKSTEIIETGANEDAEDHAPAEMLGELQGKNDTVFQDDSPTDTISHENEQFATPDVEDLYLSLDKPSGKKEAFSETSSSSTAKTSAPEAIDDIVRQTQTALNQRLQNNKMWAQKLLFEVVSYSKTLSAVHAEYLRTQAQEQHEAQRLDQVEPDVEGATCQMLDTATTSGSGFDSVHHRDEQSTEVGSKRRFGQE